MKPDYEKMWNELKVAITKSGICGIDRRLQITLHDMDALEEKHTPKEERLKPRYAFWEGGGECGEEFVNIKRDDHWWCTRKAGHTGPHQAPDVWFKDGSYEDVSSAYPDENEWQPKVGEWVWDTSIDRPHQYHGLDCSDMEPLESHLPILEYKGFKVGDLVTWGTRVSNRHIAGFKFVSGNPAQAWFKSARVDVNINDLVHMPPPEPDEYVIPTPTNPKYKGTNWSERTVKVGYDGTLWIKDDNDSMCFDATSLPELIKVLQTLSDRLNAEE